MSSHISQFSSKYALWLITFVFIALGIYHLTHFETADEHYWISERIPQYWEALRDGKYKKTLINDKPGVSLALASGIALPFVGDTLYYDSLSRENNTPPKQIGSDASQHLFALFRFPIILINAILLFFLFRSARIVCADSRAALFGILFVGWSPILIGMSQIVNPDALFWSFGSGALLSFMVFLHTRHWRDALITSIFFAFALLSKYTAAIFIPLFVLAAVIDHFLTSPHTKTPHRLFITLLSTLGIGIVSALLITLLLPAVFLKPSILFDLTVSFSSVMPIVLFGTVLFGISAVIIDETLASWRNALPHILRFLGRCLFAGLFSLILFLLTARIAHDPSVFDRVPFDAKNIGSVTAGSEWFELILLEYNPLVFSLSPVVLLLLMMLWARYAFFSHPLENSGKRFAFILILSLPFAMMPLGYLLAKTVATVRYLILLYPLAGILAGLEAVHIFTFLTTRFTRKYAHGFILLCVTASFFSVVKAAPFYLTYTNTFLPKKALISDAWGYGGFEAAQFINAQPNAKNLIVWTDYYGVCPFIDGVCITNTKFDTTQYPIDYAVLTRRGEIKLNPNHAKWSANPELFFITPLYKASPVWQLCLNDRPENCIKIVTVKSE